MWICALMSVWFSAVSVSKARAAHSEISINLMTIYPITFWWQIDFLLRYPIYLNRSCHWLAGRCSLCHGHGWSAKCAESHFRCFEQFTWGWKCKRASKRLKQPTKCAVCVLRCWIIFVKLENVLKDNLMPFCVCAGSASNLLHALMQRMFWWLRSKVKSSNKTPDGAL